jgi:hypothetical protein
MPSVYVDIDLDEIESHELIDELESRSLCLSDSEKDQLLDIISYADSEKWKLFLAIKNKYSLYELQQMFDEKGSVPVSKEQLPIPFESIQPTSK